MVSTPGCSELPLLRNEPLACPFTTFPREISVEIAKELDWYSLLNIRQTCTFLNAVSRVRDVWVSQYHQFVEKRLPSARLERPLDSYSVQELERWVLIRRSADVGWRSQGTKFTRNRWVSQSDIESSYLVPGGRWFLVGALDGSMTVCDLDAATISGRPLIAPDHQQPIRYIAIDIDSPTKSPNLTFTMALSPLASRGSRFKIGIWRVTLTGHGTDARLTANHLCSIQDHDIAHIRDIAFHRNLFARIYMRSDMSYIEVLDWKRSTPSAHFKALIFSGPPGSIHTIRFLSGDRILASSRDHIMIYTFAIVEMGTTAPTGAPKITEPLWKLPFPGQQECRDRFSRGFSNETATYFVVEAKHFHGLIVPHNEHQTPHFRLLMDSEIDSQRNSFYALGFQKAFIQDIDWVATRLSFSWTGDMGSSPANTCGRVISRDYPPCDRSRPPQLDEETGRIVQKFKDGFRVIDTALVYMDSDELREDHSYPSHFSYPSHLDFQVIYLE